jgi:uncharacterized membrane protein YphA (DoxX/SURF4 family)
LRAIGVPAPHFMAWSTVLVELVGGVAILLGAVVALVSIPMAAVLLVAIFKVHLPNGFSSVKLLAVTAAGAQFGHGLLFRRQVEPLGPAAGQPGLRQAWRNGREWFDPDIRIR